MYKINYTKHINHGDKPGWSLKALELISRGSFKTNIKTVKPMIHLITTYNLKMDKVD